MFTWIIDPDLIQIAFEAKPIILAHKNQDSAEVNDRGNYQDNCDEYVEFD